MQVRKDALLVELESQELRAALAQAQASRAAGAGPAGRLAQHRARRACRPSLEQAQAAATAAQAEFDAGAATGGAAVSQRVAARRRAPRARCGAGAARRRRAPRCRRWPTAVPRWCRRRPSCSWPTPASPPPRPGWRRPACARRPTPRCWCAQVEPGQIVQPGKALLTLALAGADPAQRPGRRAFSGPAGAGAAGGGGGRRLSGAPFCGTGVVDRAGGGSAARRDRGQVRTGGRCARRSCAKT